MYHLIVAKFPNEEDASAARDRLLELHHERLLNVEDINIAVKKPNGYVELLYNHNLMQACVVMMIIIGLIVGFISKAIVTCLVISVALGLLFGYLVGKQGTISDTYARRVASKLKVNRAELFVLSLSDSKLLRQHISNLGGRVVKSTIQKS